MSFRLAIVAFAALTTTAQGQDYPYAIKSFGMYRAIILQGDFSPKIDLKTVMASRPTTGMGALSDARGEITIYDGKLIVSYGKDASHPAAQAETAGLLSIATAPEWQTAAVERDVAPDEIESYISKAAGAHGLNPEGPFPFQIRGTIASYVMHVNSGPTNGPHGMGYPIAVTIETKGDSIAGAVAGIYTSSDLVGVVSHGGTRTHSHWVSADGTATAHLDRWGLKAGAILSLPKR